MADGTAPFSFCKQLLENKAKTGMSDLEVSFCEPPLSLGPS